MDKSISFKEEMLKAILDGRKTQTRRPHAEAKYQVGDIVQVKGNDTFIKINAVRKEKLQDITEQDAIAEGLIKVREGRFVMDKDDIPNGMWFPNHISCFSCLWGFIYNEDEQKQWGTNPWVWVYEFEVIND